MGKREGRGRGWGGRLVVLRDFFQQKKIRVRGNGNLWNVERREELKEENLALIFLLSWERRNWFQDSCALDYTERKT